MDGMVSRHHALDEGSWEPYEDGTIIISTLNKGKLKLREVK